jgi:formylglycine-generating enzyme required for sulfatase activity
MSESEHPGPSAPPLRVFLGHAREDQEVVLALYHRLRADGITPWLDKKDLLPGQKWRVEIQRAVRQADVVLICLSAHAVTKQGFLQREVKLALDVAEEQPDGAIWIIPVRLEACDVHERLSEYHWCDYFEEEGYDLLLKALHLRATQLGRVLAPPPPPPPPPDPAREWLDTGQYGRAVALLEPRARAGDAPATRLLAEVVETAAAPRDLRLQAAGVLAQVGDPRPGVGTLPPAMVEIDGGTFVIGVGTEDVEEYVAAFKRDYPDVEEGAIRSFVQEWVNTQPLEMRSFEIARYPITNAQYKLFIDDDGYHPALPWWDEAARAWLRRDDEAAKGLESWQKRKHKHQPESWEDERFGIARPNHPVVDISWYEAVAFCRWLTQHRGYNPEGYVYRLPTEAEWEYAARRNTRRIYPWGNEEPDDERANFNRTHEGTTAVGCFPLGTTADGLHDLAGNVWEWTGTVYQAYPYDPTDGREHMDDPADSFFVLRGGGWDPLSVSLRASSRYYSPPDARDDDIGFRPARLLP